VTEDFCEFNLFIRVNKSFYEDFLVLAGKLRILGVVIIDFSETFFSTVLRKINNAPLPPLPLTMAFPIALKQEDGGALKELPLQYVCICVMVSVCV